MTHESRGNGRCFSSPTSKVLPEPESRPSQPTGRGSNIRGLGRPKPAMVVTIDIPELRGRVGTTVFDAIR